MMCERGLQVDHTTIYRWVQHYAPELEKRCRPRLKAQKSINNFIVCHLDKTAYTG
jgi:transposase-like protein